MGIDAPKNFLGKNYINGQWKGPSRGGAYFVDRNPAHTNDFPLGHFPCSSAQEVDEAVQAATQAQKSWKKVSRVRRGYLFEAFIDLVKAQKEDLARLVTLECGKSLNEGRADVIEGIHMAQYTEGEGRKPYGTKVPSEIDEKRSSVERRPEGVHGIITPWNFPFAIPLWLIGPSLMEGNTVVFKPSEETPFIAQRLVELMDKDGFPPGVVNLVQGFGEETGQALVGHPDVTRVLFTGSREVGSSIMRTSAEMFLSSGRLMPVCEMGGKNALLILDDADMEIALNAAVLGAYKTTGQRCVSPSRIIIDEKRKQEFTERFVEASRRVKIGEPLREDTLMGPLINKASLDKVQSYNNLAGEEITTYGGQVFLDTVLLMESDMVKIPELPSKDIGEVHGSFISPFVYTMKHTSASRVLREEVFGPHVAIIPVGSLEEAIAVHNDTPYGLAMAVITESYRAAQKVFEECEFGLGYHNLPTIGAEVQLPFGGVKGSGSGVPSAAALFERLGHLVTWTENYGRELKMAQGLSAKID